MAVSWGGGGNNSYADRVSRIVQEKAKFNRCPPLAKAIRVRPDRMVAKGKDRDLRGKTEGGKKGWEPYFAGEVEEFFVGERCPNFVRKGGGGGRKENRAI